MWMIINSLFRKKGLYVGIFIAILFGMLYYYKYRLVKLEKKYNELKMENQILNDNVKVLKEKNKTLSKTISILKIQKAKNKKIIVKAKLEKFTAKKIIPKNKARLSYDEQKKVINYINSIFTDN